MATMLRITAAGIARLPFHDVDGRPVHGRFAGRHPGREGAPRVEEVPASPYYLRAVDHGDLVEVPPEVTVRAPTQDAAPPTEIAPVEAPAGDVPAELDPGTAARALAAALVHDALHGVLEPFATPAPEVTP